MNEELQQKLLEALTVSMDTIKDIKDFSVEQAPEVLQQALMWYGTYYFILLMLGISLIVVAVVVVVKTIKHIKAQGEGYDAFNIVMVMVVSEAILLIFIIGCINLQWLQIWIAPKLFLLEWLKGMM